jgi:hypothetical protein
LRRRRFRCALWSGWATDGGLSSCCVDVLIVLPPLILGGKI